MKKIAEREQQTQIFLRCPKALLGAFAVAVCLAAGPTTSCFAQSRPGNPDMKIGDTERHQVVDALIHEMNTHYIFPEIARRVADDLLMREKRGDYAALDNSENFARMLTEHIHAISKDLHLYVAYSAQTIPAEKRGDKPTESDMAQMIEVTKYFNSGIEKVERLPGNIGYIDLRGFFFPSLAGNAMAGAMTLLSDTNALIIDVRKNHGGEPSMVALTASYFFDDRTHLNDIYTRETDSTEQYWTTEHVAGTKYGQKKDLYILTSSKTFSGGEEFCNDMKTLKRATLVGETTGGGAHPGGEYRLTDHFAAFIATGRPINPITHADWEGVGVEPDVNVPADDALRTAQVRALKKLIATSTVPPQKADMEHHLAELEK
jgi:retinol-binding protein 3